MSRNERIVLMAGDLARAGAPMLRTVMLGRALHALGHPIALATEATQVADDLMALIPSGADLIALPASGPRRTRAARRVAALRRYRPDRLVTRGSGPRTLLTLAAAGWSRPARLTVDLQDVPRAGWNTPTVALFAPQPWPRELTLRRLVTDCYAVSSVLAAWARQRGLPVRLVPPFFPSDLFESSGASISPVRAPDGRQHLAFAGTVTGKDEITVRNLIGALADPELARRYHVHIVGPGEVARTAGVTWHGRLSLASSQAVVSSCDAVVLQRPGQVAWAAAGFPSKIAEAWMLGVPVLVTDTGGLADRLVVGGSGELVSGADQESLRAALHRFDRQRLWPGSRIARWAARTFSEAAAIESLAVGPPFWGGRR